MADTPVDSILAQILLKQGEMSTQLAVISEQLKGLPDHESRIRALEGFRWKLTGGVTVLSLASGLAGALIGHLSH
jgi:hypothetical protein